MKYWFGKIHLWIGLPLGVLFFVISFSGALYTWEPEIATIIYKEIVEPQDKPFASVTTFKKSVEQALPNGDFRTVLYRGKSRAVQILLYVPGTYFIANLNPYTGEVLHLQDMKKGWLNYLKFLHRNLILDTMGRQIVHWGTLLYLIMTLTGIVIWWPSKKKERKQKFMIKWGASGKRLNYDLHNVLGFYSSWVLLFLIVTGLFWGFELVKKSLRAINGEDQIKYEKPQSLVDSSKIDADQFQLMEKLGENFREVFPDHPIRISNPHAADDPIQVTVVDNIRLVSRTDQYYFDRYTGKRLVGNFQHGMYLEASFFTTLNGLVYDIHLGNIFGLTSRILVFIAGLIGASLPITGFIFWWNNRKK